MVDNLVTLSSLKLQYRPKRVNVCCMVYLKHKYSMKKIGEGYCYNVYDLGDGRVLKKQKGILRMVLFIVFANKGNIKNSLKECRTLLSAIPIMRPLYEKLFSRLTSYDLIGNPILLDGINYTQDIVTVQEHSSINTMASAEFEKLLADYVELIKICWSYGFSDVVYNFTKNNGYTHEGKFILIDFNEITFDKERVQGDLASSVWLSRYSYSHLDSEKQFILKEVLGSQLRISVLEEMWNSQKI